MGARPDTPLPPPPHTGRRDRSRASLAAASRYTPLVTPLARHHSTAFLATAVLLALGWLAIGPSVSGQAAVLVLLGGALVLGLPHGALDLWIAGRQGMLQGARGWLGFHAGYLAIAGLVVAAFLLAPGFALLGFLLLSLWHFADDWAARGGKGGLPKPIAIGCASAIVLVPTAAHPGEVAAIFAAIMGEPVPDLGGARYLAGLTTGWVVGGSLVAAVAIDRRAGLEAAAVALLAFVLPPLAFFAAYFTLLHGPRHLIRHGALTGGRHGRITLAAYAALAFALVAGLGVWLARAEPQALGAEAIRAAFVGLAALTVPHALLLERDKRLFLKSLSLTGATDRNSDEASRRVTL